MKLQSLEEIWNECETPFVAKQMIPSGQASEYSFFDELTPIGTIATVITKKPQTVLYLGVQHTYEFQGTYIHPESPECEELLRLDHTEKLWTKLR